jgi:prevent-host-death family protein
MNSFNITDARRRLSKLVTLASRGESVWITRSGRKVARLGPANPENADKLPDLTNFRKSIRVHGKPLSHAITNQRRKARY